MKRGLDSERKNAVCFWGVKVSYRKEGMERFAIQGVAPSGIETYGSLWYLLLWPSLCVLSQAICDHRNVPWEILQRANIVSAVIELVVPA